MRRRFFASIAWLLFVEDRARFLLGHESVIGDFVRHAYERGLADGRAETQEELEQLRATLESGVQA